MTSILPTIIILSEPKFLLNYMSPLFKRSMQGNTQEKDFLKEKHFYSTVLFYEVKTELRSSPCPASHVHSLSRKDFCLYVCMQVLQSQAKLSRISIESVESQTFHEGYREGKWELLLVFKWKYLPLQIKKKPSICACSRREWCPKHCFVPLDMHTLKRQGSEWCLCVLYLPNYTSSNFASHSVTTFRLPRNVFSHFPFHRLKRRNV